MKGTEVSNQMQQQVSRKSLLRRAALVVGIGAAGALAAPAVASAAEKTGQYAGNGTATQIATGLTSILALWIVLVPERGPGVEAFTTDAIQAALGQGTVLVNGKKDSGVAIERGNFTVALPALNQSGVTYFWAAIGD